MIGLKRHTVVIENHDESWLTLGANRCNAIREACIGIAIEVQHVGSTSVMALPAKPIIDIVIGLDDMRKIDELKIPLCAIGYIYRGIGPGAIGHMFVRESSPDVRVEHVHVVLSKGEHWNCYVDFRDELRRNSILRRQYAELKRTLAERFPNDRTLYGAGKDSFIAAALSAVADRTQDELGKL